jgi:hypothetical protein
MINATWAGLVLAACVVLPAAAAEPQQAAKRALAAESRVPVEVTWDSGSQRPRLVRGGFLVSGVDRAQAVRSFLKRHAALFGLDRADVELELSETRTGLAGDYLRFAERSAGLPVFDSGVVALTQNAPGAIEIRTLNLAQREFTRPANAYASIDPDAALRASQIAAGVAGAAVADVETVLGIDPAPPAALAWRVRFATDEPRASWEAFVDAGDGRVRALRDRIAHATGSGFVFDPNPVASTGNTALADNNNATSPALDAARYSVVLPRLDGSGFLRGNYADARPKVLAQRASDAGLAFAYDRSSGHFEEVMAYYHIDRTQDRVQNVLGFVDVNNRAQTVIVNAFTDDQSFYEPTQQTLQFGSGGVDDAEDAEVVIHEYGHSIQDNQVPGWGGGDEGAMGEGFGDYLAGSMSAVLSHQTTDVACIADWDATSYSNDEPPCLRRLDATKHWPEFVAAEVHDDGEMWSAALFRSWQALGADTMDKLVIEAHFLLSTFESFGTAADAIIATDATLNAGANAGVLRRSFIQQGLSRELSPPAAATMVIQQLPVSLENPRVGGVYANLLDDPKTFTQPGAAALRVHFEQIATEQDPSCVDDGCDNIYLYDGAGNLYQILNGALGPTGSVAIPGDTVRIRFVSDASVGGFGYHVDRIDVLGDDGIFSSGFEPPPP